MTGLRRREYVRAARFVLVNGVGTVLDVGLVFLLTKVLSAPLLLAVFCGWLASMLCGFYLNRRLVFADGQASLFTASRRYFALVTFNVLVGVGLVTFLVAQGWNYPLTRALSSTFLVIVNFLVARWWVFVVRLPMSQGERAALEGIAQMRDVAPLPPPAQPQHQAG
jgi:putative flippase GtrA